MGTNYYWYWNDLEKPELHIGKSSGGWCFLLHTVPRRGIEDLDDWVAFWKNNEGKGNIYDEYDRPISAYDMINIITHRCGRDHELRPPSGYQTWEAFYNTNHAQPGPNMLVRFKTKDVDPCGCDKHGAGTWDCLAGEFS